MARVVGSESIATGDFILVSHSITEVPAFDSLSDWKARVLDTNDVIDVNSTNSGVRILEPPPRST
jgi:hypothetical protein